MKLTLSAALLLASAAAASASGVYTVPIQSLRNPAHLNSESLTRRYLQKRAGASVTAPLTNVQSDLLYTISIGLGTPAQTFNLAIDTGSPITWVSSSNCVGAGCTGVKKFDCAASSTCTVSTSAFNASYVSGQSASGTYIAETYSIGSLQFRAIAGVVSTNSAKLPTNIDGIMGLWYYAQGSQIPIVNVLKNTTALAQNMFGVYLEAAQTVTSGTSAGGDITFGGVNTARFTGDITYIDCVADRPWTIPVGGVAVNGKSISASGAVATLDTGTTAILVSKTVSDSINSAIPGALQAQGGVWVLPCSGNASISLTFGTFTANIPYTSFAMQTTKMSTTQGDYCVSAAMFPTGSTVAITEWLIGAVFLKHVYSVYDFENNAAAGGRIGFAQLGSGGSTGSNTGSSGGNTGSSGNNGKGGSATGSGAAGSMSKSSALLMQAAAMVAVSALLTVF